MSTTCPETTALRQAGFATTAIIAILLMLAVLGASLAVISGTQQAGHALDVSGVKAYHAARGGLEWAMYNVLRSGGSGCAAVNGASFAFTDNLSGYRVSLACTASAHEEATQATPVNMYSLTATACNDAACPSASAPPPPYYAERQLRVTVGSN